MIRRCERRPTIDAVTLGPAGRGDLRGPALRLLDPVHDTAFDRSGDELLDGLHVQLDPWGSHLFSIQLAVREPDRREEP